MNELNSIEEIKQKFSKSKTVPRHLEEVFYNVIKHYPELENTFIIVHETKFYGIPNTLRAYPPLLSFFNKNRDRIYTIVVNLNEKIPIPFYSLTIENQQGMLAHELAHVLDYKRRSSFGCVRMGLHFLVSKKFAREMERNTDRIVVARGCGDILLSYRQHLLTKSEILHAAYINNIYLSPEEILDEMKKYSNLYNSTILNTKLVDNILKFKAHRRSLLNRIKHIFIVLVGFLPAIIEMIYILHIAKIHRKPDWYSKK